MCDNYVDEIRSGLPNDQENAMIVQYFTYISVHDKAGINEQVSNPPKNLTPLPSGLHPKPLF